MRRSFGLEDLCRTLPKADSFMDDQVEHLLNARDVARVFPFQAQAGTRKRGACDETGLRRAALSIRNLQEET